MMKPRPKYLGIKCRLDVNSRRLGQAATAHQHPLPMLANRLGITPATTGGAAGTGQHLIPILANRQGVTHNGAAGGHRPIPDPDAGQPAGGPPPPRPGGQITGSAAAPANTRSRCWPTGRGSTTTAPGRADHWQRGGTGQHPLPMLANRLGVTHHGGDQAGSCRSPATRRAPANT